MRGHSGEGCAVPRDVGDIERDIARAVLLAVRSREVELAAFELARSTSGPEAKRDMVFVSGCYWRLPTATTSLTTTGGARKPRSKAPTA